jgi:UDP-N-acetylmuramate: L-alanyl-gamma-D-glutamyl-meso-diaminopimelate ligase
MHIHILGICGTFMAGIAVLAKQLGFQVSGADTNFYPPMSDLLMQQQIKTYTGYDKLAVTDADLIIIGNAMSRGIGVIEEILNSKQAYISGPQWLANNVLINKKVVAISGTHGKTTTSSMLTWILQQNDIDAGFLIGGKAAYLDNSAALGTSDIFVIEADEYDSAFFDKRSKFIHYCPHTLVINNLEYDHADIFPNLAAIQTQFHHLVRTVPSNGTIVYPHANCNIDAVLAQGCWSNLVSFSTSNSSDTLNNSLNWQAQLLADDGSEFEIYQHGKLIDRVNWQLIGLHNVNNALAAIASASQLGVQPQDAIAALNNFSGVKRRLELLAHTNNTYLYDDFAHHPSAIATTATGLRNKIGKSAQLTLVIELASNSMRAGIHHAALPEATGAADTVIWYTHEQLEQTFSKKLTHNPTHSLSTNLAQITDSLTINQYHEQHIVVMSNGDSKAIWQTIAKSLKLSPAAI